jgi:hypothetical protein
MELPDSFVGLRQCYLMDLALVMVVLTAVSQTVWQPSDESKKEQ